jgi:hypothetical protein
MANRNFANSRLYTGHVMPVALDMNFTVAPDNGLGVTGMVGPYVQNVFMHTSTTPAAGASNPQSPGVVVVNPNPANGTVVVQLQDNYSRIYSASMSVLSSPVGTAVVITSALVVGTAYTITIVGDATPADFIAIGVPVGVTPAVGVTFIAAAVGAGTSTVTRVAPSAAAGSGVRTVEILGNANTTMSPNLSSGQGFGAQVILQFRDSSGAIAAPVTGSVIQLSLLLSNSSVLIGGE